MQGRVKPLMIRKLRSSQRAISPFLIAKTVRITNPTMLSKTPIPCVMLLKISFSKCVLCNVFFFVFHLLKISKFCDAAILILDKKFHERINCTHFLSYIKTF